MKAIVLGAVVLFSLSTQCWASKSYLQQFKSTYSKYPAGTCKTCHGTLPQLNPYGLEFQSKGHDFLTIEPLDSDGDGFSNIDEIKPGTNPGDKNSHPSLIESALLSEEDLDV